MFCTFALLKSTTIKKNLKNSTSIALIAAVLLQFAIQFAHAFENHKHNVCSFSSETHFDTHINDCDVFHYKINHNSYQVSSLSSASDITFSKEKNFGVANFTNTYNFHFKLGRSPPVFC